MQKMVVTSETCSSGGPVFNLNGRVIGVATAYIAGGQNLNFAMPVNYLKTLTPTRVKVYSLPKVQLKPRGGGTEKDLVRVFDISYRKNWIYFAIKNNGHYAIQNIKVFFLYTIDGEVVSYSSQEYKTQILPKLALQFSHLHLIRGFPIKVEVRILDYEIDRSVGTSPVDLLFK